MGFGIFIWVNWLLWIFHNIGFRFYGDNHGENFSQFWQKDRSYLDSLNLKEVLNRTRSDLQILNCKFMNHGCTGDWTDIETIYGVWVNSIENWDHWFRCKQFVPQAKFFDEEYKRAATFGRQSSLSIVTQYNSSDWSSGWAHFVDGQTVFISPRHEQILDPDDSVVVNPGAVPIVSIRHLKQIRLPAPYSTCVSRDNHHLKYFQDYTKKHCIFECLVDIIYER